MIVMCEGCETSFQVEERLIKSTGSKVRCSKCRHVFVAYSPAAAAVPDEPLILSDELPAALPAGEQAELPEIGAQIDALFANDFEVAAGPSADQEPELLDVDDLLVEDAPGVSTLASGAPDDDLKLDLDLDLNFDEDLVQKSPRQPDNAPSPVFSSDAAPIDFRLDTESSREAAPTDTLASLDELGIKLDSLENLDDETVSAAVKTEFSAGPHVPESDPDLELNELLAEPPEELPAEISIPGLDEILPDEVSDSPTAPTAISESAAMQPSNESELDLSDLEAMLEGGSRETDSRKEATAELDLELDLNATDVSESEKIGDLEELDLTSITSESVAVDPAIIADGVSKEFDLALDVEDGPIPEKATAASAEPQDDELDFSDITNILEEPPAELGRAAEDAPPRFDLTSDDEQPPIAPSMPAPHAEASDGLLLDLESLLEDEDSGEVSTEHKVSHATDELDLDFAVGPEAAAADDLEIEIESVPADGIENNVPAEPVAAVDAPDAEPADATDRFAADESAETGSGEATGVIAMESAAAAALTAATPRRSNVRKYLLTAAGVVVLSIAAILVSRSLGIQIPFLSNLEIPIFGKFFETQPEDIAGNLKLAPIAENLTAEFIDHPAVGRLCVVKGQIRNNYDHPRSAIQVTAKLYTKDKTLAKTATVFAGNVLSNQELASQDMAAIAERLKNREGANHVNVGVKPGRSIPFMAVFDNLPNNLDEYSVEVAGSTK